MKKLVDRIPEAFSRLNPTLFVEQPAKRIPAEECKVLYVNPAYRDKVGSDEELILNFAYTLCPAEEATNRVYADLQKDSSDVALSGNLGSGRACYFGDVYNIKGIGRTSLARADPESQHGNGRLDCATALKEAIMSQYICENTETKTSPVVAVMLIPYKTKYYWSEEPLFNALLIREDKGSLDRLTHLEHSPILKSPSLDELANSYGTFDAELFSHQLLHGAWSNGNLSLNGNWLDMESVSFVPSRGPTSNITKNHLSNIFGWESKGALNVLENYTKITGEELNTEIFWNAYYSQLAKEFTRLSGISASKKMLDDWVALSKLSCSGTPISVFESENPSPGYVDFNKLFRNLPEYISNKTSPESILEETINESENIFRLNNERDAVVPVIEPKEEVRKRLYNFVSELVSNAQRKNLVQDNNLLAPKKNFLELTKIVSDTLDDFLSGKTSSEECQNIFSNPEIVYKGRTNLN